MSNSTSHNIPNLVRKYNTTARTNSCRSREFHLLHHMPLKARQSRGLASDVRGKARVRKVRGRCPIKTASTTAMDTTRMFDAFLTFPAEKSFSRRRKHEISIQYGGINTTATSSLKGWTRLSRLAREGEGAGRHLPPSQTQRHGGKNHSALQLVRFPPHRACFFPDRVSCHVPSCPFPGFSTVKISRLFYSYLGRHPSPSLPL